MWHIDQSRPVSQISFGLDEEEAIPHVGQHCAHDTGAAMQPSNLFTEA